jgi:hypothetical protein
MKPSTVDEYIAGLDEWQSEIVTALRRLVLEAVPEARERFKWSQPVYESNGPFCFIKAHKKHVNFGFWWGVELDDPLRLLEGSGEKMRHVKVTSLEKIQQQAFRDLARSSAEANQRLGDPSKTRKQ